MLLLRVLVLVLLMLIRSLQLLLHMIVILLPIIETGRKHLHVFLSAHVLVQGWEVSVHLLIIHQRIHALASIHYRPIKTLVVLILIGCTVLAISIVGLIITP